MDQALNSQKTPHTSPLRASYGMSFVSILMKNDRVIKGFYCSHICNMNVWSGTSPVKSVGIDSMVLTTLFQGGGENVDLLSQFKIW